MTIRSGGGDARNCCAPSSEGARDGKSARRGRIALAAVSVGMDAFAGATPSTSEHRTPRRSASCRHRAQSSGSRSCRAQTITVRHADVTPSWCILRLHHIPAENINVSCLTSEERVPCLSPGPSRIARENSCPASSPTRGGRSPEKLCEPATTRSGWKSPLPIARCSIATSRRSSHAKTGRSSP